MEPAILINFGTLSKPTYCLSESSWKITYLLVFIFNFNTYSLLYTLIQKNIYTQLSHYIHIIDIVNTI